MHPKSQRSKRRAIILSSLNAAIDAMSVVNNVLSTTPAKAAFGSACVILTAVRDSMINEEDYVDLGLACADVCRALDRGMNGRRVDELSQSVFEAIAQLTTTSAEIQREVIKRIGRNAVSRLFHAKVDKDTIAAWKLDLNRILHVFNTELAINTHMMVLDIHRNVLAGQESNDGRHHSTQASIPPGELPPPPPRACFGRNELIEEITDLAENLTPIALIGAGGIGKTSIALTVLHHDRTRQRFGNDRRFIRCDQFLTSRTHFLNRLSKVIGAGIENPDDLAPLRPFLSSKEMFIILDNAESILDPQGTNAREIYTVVEELSRFQTVCLCITSRISTVPQHCQRPIIPTLSMESACDILYGIHKNGGQSNIISNLLRQLDFHPLSITLLATAASHNMWDFDRLAQEWDAHRVRILQVDCNESLATTIELSLASPTFRELGPDARDILGVVAFFPQGINENNADWLLPTTSGRRNIFDKFCVLSLTHRSNGFITMLAPLRDYLRPKDPASSTLLRITKESYFSRLSVRVEPDKPGFEKAQWITSEDLNIEHLLDVFTSIDVHSVGVWTACANFMRHLYWFKKRLVVLGSKIEGLPDDHPSKPSCLSELSRLFDSTGNRIESRRLLTHALKLWRERGDDLQVAHTLRFLADANRLLGLHKEGIQRVEEALGIYEQFNDISGQAHSLQYLAWLLHDDNQLDAAKEAASRVIDLLPNKGEQFLVCRCHRVLGLICLSKGETEEAITHFETALGIASPFSWHSEQFWNHHSLARLFSKRGRFKDAHAHVERAKSHAIDAPYLLGRAVRLQARIWYKERRFEEAKSGALRAIGIYEKIGAVEEVEHCRAVLRNVEEKMKKSVTSGGSNFNTQGTRRHHKRTLPQITDLASGQAYNS